MNFLQSFISNNVCIKDDKRIIVWILHALLYIHIVLKEPKMKKALMKRFRQKERDLINNDFYLQSQLWSPINLCLWECLLSKRDFVHLSVITGFS